MPYGNLSFRLGGLNLDEDPGALERGELIVAKNAYRRGSLVGTRPGVQALGSGKDYENAVTGGNEIRGACEFRTSYDEGRRLIVIAEGSGSEVFYQDGAQLPGTPSIAPSNDYVYSMAVHNNKMYVAGGPPGKAQVQTERFLHWDGNVSNAIANLSITDKGTTQQLYPKFVKSWRN